MKQAALEFTGKIAVGAIVLLATIMIGPAASAQSSVPITYTDSAHGLVLGPFNDDFSSAETDAIVNGVNGVGGLQNMCAGEPDTAYTTQANLAAFRTMNGHGVIAIISHGVVAEDGTDLILTREPVVPSPYPSPSNLYFDDKAKGRIRDGWNLPLFWPSWVPLPRLLQSIYPYYGEFWDITPQFVNRYAGGAQNVLVYASACESAAPATAPMSSAFLGQSPGGAYFGYTDDVRVDAANAAGPALFQTLTDLTTTDDQRTALNGFSSGVAIAPDLSLDPDKSLLVISGTVVNGGFEDVGGAGAGGHLTGWTKHFAHGAGPLDGNDCTQDDYGSRNPPCEPAGDSTHVVATRAEHDGKTGSWSAQLGMWWEAGFYCDDWDEVWDVLGCKWVAGTEPAGDDQIYQDVQLGSGQQGGPTSFALTYSYKMKTYENLGTLFPSDFMYVLGKDLNTGKQFQVDTESPAAAESVSQGNASVTCCDNQAAVGCAVTSNRTILLRSWDRTIITYSSRKVAEDTTNISIAAMPAA